MDQPRRRGRPPGSKNRPPPVVVEDGHEAEAAEEKLRRALPLMIDVLVNSALQNRDAKAAEYLINRVLGRPTEKAEVKTEASQQIVIEYKQDWRKS